MCPNPQFPTDLVTTHLPKKSLMGNFIFCAVIHVITPKYPESLLINLTPILICCWIRNLFLKRFVAGAILVDESYTNSCSSLL